MPGVTVDSLAWRVDTTRLTVDGGVTALGRMNAGAPGPAPTMRPGPGAPASTLRPVAVTPSTMTGA